MPRTLMAALAACSHRTGSYVTLVNEGLAGFASALADALRPVLPGVARAADGVAGFITNLTLGVCLRRPGRI